MPQFDLHINHAKAALAANDLQWARRELDLAWTYAQGLQRKVAHDLANVIQVAIFESYVSGEV